MKVVHAFVHLFAIFAFLTLGSLLVIVAFHLLSVEDAILKLREVYANPMQSIQAGFLGFLFIMVGLVFSKMLVKKGREPEALIFQSDIGPIVVSLSAVEDLVKKVLKRFHIVKEAKIKSTIRGKDIAVKLRLTLWSGGQVAELLPEIQQGIRSRCKKLLGTENKVEVTCDVQRIEDHDVEVVDVHQKSGSLVNF